MQKILKVESLNLESKKQEIKDILIECYATLLDSIQSKIQIICKSEEYDINKYKIVNSLYSYIENYTKEHNIVNKTLYMIIEHPKQSILNSNLEVLKKCLMNMNMGFEEIIDDGSYKYNKITDMTRKYVKDDKYYYKTLYVRDWPYLCVPGWLEFLYNTPMNIDINTYISPQNTQKSIQHLKRKLICFGVNTMFESERTDDINKFSNEIESTNLMLDELRSNAGKFFLVSYYITVKGRTKDELNENYLTVKQWLEGRNILTNSCLFFQHRAYTNNAFSTTDILEYNYNFTTSSLKCFFPFQCLNICDDNGIYVGVNQNNKNLIFLDLFARQYAVMLILGIMGSGKSFLAKHLINSLSEFDVEVTILDKSGEYEIFKDKKNVNVYSKKTLREYVEITKNYLNNVNNDFDKHISKPRLFLTDELWSYINDNEYSEQFNTLFSDMILEGRKKYLGVCFISQLIESLINNKAGQTIMKTANIKFLMKMNYNEAKLISNEFDLNVKQENYLVTCEQSGLMIVNSNCVKFKVEVDDNSNNLYNTNPNRRYK